MAEDLETLRQQLARIEQQDSRVLPITTPAVDPNYLARSWRRRSGKPGSSERLMKNWERHVPGCVTFTNASAGNGRRCTPRNARSLDELEGIDKRLADLDLERFRPIHRPRQAVCSGLATPWKFWGTPELPPRPRSSVGNPAAGHGMYMGWRDHGHRGRVVMITPAESRQGGDPPLAEQFDALPEAEKRRLRRFHRDTLAASGQRDAPAMATRIASTPSDTTSERSSVTNIDLMETARQNGADARRRLEAIRQPPSGVMVVVRSLEARVEERVIVYAEAEKTLGQLEVARRNTSDRVLCAALKSDFESDQVEEIDNANSRRQPADQGPVVLAAANRTLWTCARCRLAPRMSRATTTSLAATASGCCGFVVGDGPVWEAGGGHDGPPSSRISDV